jgi:hypothetical protein
VLSAILVLLFQEEKILGGQDVGGFASWNGMGSIGDGNRLSVAAFFCGANGEEERASSEPPAHSRFA